MKRLILTSLAVSLGTTAVAAGRWRMVHPE